MKKWFRRIFYGSIIVVLALIALAYATGYEYLIKAVAITYGRGNSTASIDDGKYFSQTLVLSQNPTAWAKNATHEFVVTDELQAYFKRAKTAQFLVIKNDALLFEQNFRTDEATFNSFSMTKTIVTLLLGFAIQDGVIQSLNTPITTFLPEFKGKGFADKVCIADLSKMTSGLKWNETYYSPTDEITRYYYDDKLDKAILKLEFLNQPNKTFEYQSANTQLLGLIIRRATKKSLSQYLQEKLWNPLGMESDGEWSLDGAGGVEKAFCCFEAIPRDYAKIAKFIKNDGIWNGQQLLNPYFIHLMKKPDLTPQYGYSLWMDWKYEKPFYLLQGILGQYAIVLPEEDIIIVKIGEKKDHEVPKIKEALLADEIYFIINQVNKGIKQKSI